VLFQVPPFELVSSAGRPFGSADLAGEVYVAGFFFTRCASVCPLLVESMSRLARRYDEAGVERVRLVLLTVDPDHDTPERLREYAATHRIDTGRWALLTGGRESVERLVLDGFKMAMGPREERGGIVDIAHSGQLLLVDGSGRVRGFYASDGAGLDELFHRSQHVLKAG
jgi:protein SCO1/2